MALTDICKSDLEVQTSQSPAPTESSAATTYQDAEKPALSDLHTPMTIGHDGRSDTSRVGCTWPSCLETFGFISERDRHYRTVHSNNGERPYKCLRDGCPADVRSWTNPEKLRAHIKRWHGPYTCLVLSCSRRFPHGFGSQGELDEHQRSEHKVTPTIPPSSSSQLSVVDFDGGSVPEPADKGKAVSSKLKIRRYSALSKTASSERSQYPTGWSDWAWNVEYDCNSRYRLVAPNDYQYEFGPVQAPDAPITSTSNVEPIDEQTNFSTFPISASFDSVAQAWAGTKLDSVANQEMANTQSWSAPVPRSKSYQGYITTRNPNTSTEVFNPSYRVHAGHEFKWGRVFKVLWAEPKGDLDAGDESEHSRLEREGRFREKFYEKVRRFVIIDHREGHCICLPIMTYSGRGVNKRGLHAEDHAIIWTEKPTKFEGEEEKGLTKTPIRVQPSNKRHKLHEASRLNYDKLYTVEYNVKVWFVGKIHTSSENTLITDYNAVHPPMQHRVVKSLPADTDSYTGGATSTYQVPYATYTVPSASYATSVFEDSTMVSRPYLGSTGAATRYDERQEDEGGTADRGKTTTPHTVPTLQATETFVSSASDYQGSGP